MGMLDGKVALVTGAGGGLGRAHAMLLAREGASVVVNDLGGARDGTGSSNTMAQNVVEEIKAEGGQAVANYGSVTDRNDAVAMVEETVSAFGKIDILIANAGILRDKSFKNMDDEMWDVVMDVHLRGTYLSTKAAYDKMIEQGDGGRIIMTSSTSGLLGNFGQTNYGAAKAAVHSLTWTFSAELAPKIRVNTVAPGPIPTEIMLKAIGRKEDELDKVLEEWKIPMERLGTPQDIGAACVYLASDASSWVTGEILRVGGGAKPR